MPSRTARNNRVSRAWYARSETAFVMLIGLLVGLSYGLSFGDPWSNHPQYIIPGLRLLNPDFLKYDWWAIDTTHFHHRFSFLVAGLSALHILPWGLAIGNVLTIAATLAIIYALIRRIDQERALQIWLLFLVLFVGLIHTQSIATSFFFSPSLQPSTLATLGYCGAILFFFDRRFLLSGTFLAFAGFFHTNYLILGFPLFGIAHLALGRKELFTRIWRQFLLSLLVLGLELPNILNVIGVDLPEAELKEASRIFMDSLPFHFRPLTFLWSFIPFVGWNLMAWPHLDSVIRDDKIRAMFKAIYMSFLIVLGGATLLTTFVFIDYIGRLQILRMAPFALMLAQIILAGLAVHLFAWGGDLPQSLKSAPRVMISALSAVMVVIYFLWRQDPLPSIDGFLLLAMVMAFAIVLLGRAFKTSIPKYWERLGATPVVTVSLVALVLISLIDDIRLPLYNVACPRCYLEQEQALFDWVRTTDPESVFLIPPTRKQLEGFRLFGERAIVVDWRGLPHRPDEILEWYDRMRKVTAFYARLETPNLMDIAGDYGADYIILPSSHTPPASWGESLFRNQRYSVYKIPSNSGNDTIGLK